MSAAEREACQMLLKQTNTASALSGGSEDGGNDAQACSNAHKKIQALRQKRKLSQISASEKSTHCDCSFILGSAAEVERLWSESQWLLDRHRTKLDPKLLEAMLILRKNRDLWKPIDVACALDAQKKETGEIRQRKQAKETESILMELGNN